MYISNLKSSCAATLRVSESVNDACEALEVARDESEEDDSIAANFRHNLASRSENWWLDELLLAALQSS